MNNSLFPKYYYQLPAPQLGTFNIGYRGKPYLLSSNIFYSYVSVPYTIPHHNYQRYYGINSYQQINPILIAILVLVAMDFIFVRPYKK
jgi:hypothetical protein